MSTKSTLVHKGMNLSPSPSTLVSSHGTVLWRGGWYAPGLFLVLEVQSFRVREESSRRLSRTGSGKGVEKCWILEGSILLTRRCWFGFSNGVPRTWGGDPSKRTGSSSTVKTTLRSPVSLRRSWTVHWSVETVVFTVVFVFPL